MKSPSETNSLVLNGAAEESPAREAGDGAVVDVLGGRLLAHLALLRRRDQRVRNPRGRPRRPRGRLAVGGGPGGATAFSCHVMSVS